MKLNYSTECMYWFQYIQTASILNAWDTTCDAMNGSDFDGDTNMCTDNPILLKNTKPTRAIMCLQKKAEKKVPTEEDIITANKLAFNDDIGTVTNRVTSMIERQAGFPKDSDEYKILEYRIMCGQSYQQATIDRAKGIVAKSMPEAWYSFRDCVIRDDDDEETAALKRFNQRIVAENKPYFMIYVYPQLRKKYRDYVKSGDEGVRRRYGHMGYNSIDALRDIPEKTQEIETCIDFYDRFIPTGNNNCVVNRISWLFEQEFDGYLRRSAEETEFDCSILKSGKNYTKQTYNKVLALSKDYRKKVEQYFKRASEEKLSEFDSQEEKQIVTLAFIAECEKVCSNEDELCDIVVDMCYRDGQSKQFAWDICGEVMVRNLARHSGAITYPERATDEKFDFDYCGDNYILRTVPFNDYIE